MYIQVHIHILVHVNVQVKDVQLNCMVNRELTRRVKVCQDVSWASRAVHMDLHLLLRLVTALDKKMELWEYGEEGNGKVCVCTQDRKENDE